MNKTVKIAFSSVIFLLAFTASADEVVINDIYTADLSEYANCHSSDRSCLQVRTQLLEVLQNILIELQAQLAELQAQKLSTEDLEATTYAILSDTTLAGEKSGIVHPVALEIWSIFKAVARAEDILEHLTFFQVFKGSEDEDNEDLIAYVETDRNDQEKWVLGVNLEEVNLKSKRGTEALVETMVHEYAHVLTINPTQLSFYTSENSCKRYWAEEGCYKSGSYLNDFVEEFWSSNKHENYREDVLDEDDQDDQDELIDEFYDDREDEFVTNYAATNPEEDIAETFALFVLEDKPNDNEIADEKILFFYDYNELVNLKEEILDSLEDII